MVNKKSKQVWDIGNQVKVGFLTLTIKAIADIKDGLPDIYLLERNGSYYEFVPHNGLTKLSNLNAWKVSHDV